MNHRSNLKRTWPVVAMAILLPVGAITANAQQPATQDEARAGGRGQFAGMQRIAGTITDISGAQITIKTVDGAAYQVVTTDNTRVMHGRGNPIKVGDLKSGDGLMAMGNLDAANKTMHAAMVISLDADQIKRMEDAQKQQFANLGKTMIAGRVTAIDLDNATMTVERPDGVSQTIGFDENTSFRRGRLGMGNGMAQPGVAASGGPAGQPPSESITLADIKVGDRVMGPGEVKGGRFVAKELTAMTPGAGRRRSSETPSNGTPENSNPTTAAPSKPK